jgi:glutamate-1-semialdehyde 2,1-aminomutase
MNSAYFIAAAAVALLLLRKAVFRLQLSRAKHPSLAGHSKISRRLAKMVPFYEYGEDEAFACDGADADVIARRKAGIANLEQELRERTPRTTAFSAELEQSISDMQFTNAYRVPFQFRNFVRRHLRTGAVAEASDGVRIRDLDGNWSYDVGGSYGVNLFGYDFYKECLQRGTERASELGPVLGPYHPVIAENVRMLRKISALDEVSFHMSGTEAVMQAVRLARYHTGRSHLVMFCGAYHGWWDGVQPGVGNQRKTNDVYTLKDLSEDSLKVLRTRKDIACVLVNPLQALHPNAGAGSDATLINSARRASFDREAYSSWLRELRKVCSERGIILIFDEVFVGFRLGLRGAQGYFGVDADMVTYGKTLGGGLPNGVLCGRAELMKRYRENRPTDICFARGTFNSHPYVMTCMNEFLRHVTRPEVVVELEGAEVLWNQRTDELNRALEDRGLPVRIHNLSSIWIVTYTRPSRFNWMFQFYLRATGLSLSWVGTGRLIFSHNYSDADFEAVRQRFIAAAERMEADGWWAEIPAVTDKALKRQVFREILFGGKRRSGISGRRPVHAPRPRPLPEHGSSGRSVPLSSGTAATSDRS